MIIKVSDVSHPARPWDIHLKWSALVTEEFHRQGDREAAEDMQISPLCNRNEAVRDELVVLNASIVLLLLPKHVELTHPCSTTLHHHICRLFNRINPNCCLLIIYRISLRVNAILLTSSFVHAYQHCVAFAMPTI